jgi:hypothetical protein
MKPCDRGLNRERYSNGIRNEPENDVDYMKEWPETQ